MHPVILILTQVFLSAFAIGFTKPTSIIRPALLPFQGIALWIIHKTCLEVIPRMSVTTIVAGNALTYFLRYIELVLLSRWSFEAQGPTSSAHQHLGSRPQQYEQKPRDQYTLTRRIGFGLHTTIAQRNTNTRYQIKGVPPFSSTSPSFIPPRKSFVRKCLRDVLVCYLIIDACTFAGPPKDAGSVFAANKVPFLSRITEVSFEEFMVRVLSTLGLRLIVYCMLQMFYGLLAAVTVLLGIYEVRDWPPPFGAISEAWSIRRYWG